MNATHDAFLKSNHFEFFDDLRVKLTEEDRKTFSENILKSLKLPDYTESRYRKGRRHVPIIHPKKKMKLEKALKNRQLYEVH